LAAADEPVSVDNSRPPARLAGIRRVMIRVFALAAMIVIAYWVLLFVLQRSMAFPAPSVSSAPPRPNDVKAIWLESAAGRTEAWFLPPPDARTGPAPLVVFAHGNGELIDYWPSELDVLRHWGAGVLLVEFPGYGRSAGSPSQRSIQSVFEAAFDWAVKEPAVDSTRIILYGRSIGGGAVAGLSETRPAAALILESTFSSLSAMASAYMAPSILVRDRFDNVASVTRFKGPKLILHGEHDTIIPTAHGRRLAAAAGVELQLMPCGHNDCPRPWGIIGKFLRQHGLIGDSIR
jgi:pimeloyl-ACP methyl ester carboxylesterase